MFTGMIIGANLWFVLFMLGCGLAGLKDVDIAPMFEGLPDNCWFDEVWQHSGLPNQYWDTF